jgi:hypothetical protein
MVTAIRRGALASRWIAIRSWRLADAIEGSAVWARNTLFVAILVVLAMLIFPRRMQ